LKSLYISATEPRSGKSAVAVGLMNLMSARVDRVGYIKPIGNLAEGGRDPDVNLVEQLFHTGFPAEVLNPLGLEDARKLLGEGRTDALLTRVLKAHSKIAAKSDVVIVEGTDYTGALSALELDINADISRTLDAPVLMVASGRGRTADEIIVQILAAKESLDEKGCDFVGVIVTKVDRAEHEKVQGALKAELPKHKIELLGVIPYDDVLGRPRMGEIAQKIGARVMFGQEYLYNLVSAPRVGAMTIANVLDRLVDGMLLITPGDREDMLITAMVSRVASTYPNIAGIVLTGGLEPAASVKRLIGGLSGFRIPILQVATDTFETTVVVSRLNATLFPDDNEKIERLYRSVRQWVQQDEVYRILKIERERKTTPLVFMNSLIETARRNRKRIVMPEGDEERTLKAVARVMAEDIADIVLLGDEEKIRATATIANADIARATVIDPAKSPMLDAYSQVYFEMRKHKGITPDHARDVIMDPIYYGTMMVQLGDADGLVSGAVHTTRHTISPAFQIIKTKPGISLVSSVFFMCLEDRVLVYGDCAVNPNPTAEQLAEIAISAADTARAFGFEPLVAMLSYSTGTSGVGPEVEQVKAATDMVRAKAPNLKVEGPIQYDAAVSVETARTKLPGSEVAGHANVFIFPDLNSGNTAYKAVQRSAKAIAVGPVLQGLNKPVNDLSRGCLVEDIVYTIAITAIQAQQTKS
jgi:phosphate acetyltransferase